MEPLATESSCIGILQSEFAERCARNTRYSLRAFARDLHMSPSRLSELLNGKHGMSKTKAQLIAERLGYNDDECLHFCDLAEAQFGRSQLVRRAAQLRLTRHREKNRVNEISLDVFELIAHWYHLAIIELAQIRGFRSDQEWIARTLGITELEARLAIERLVRLDLMRWVDGELLVNSTKNHVGEGMPSRAIRAFHDQVLRKAREAIHRYTLAERDLQASIIAIPKDAFHKARVLLDDFRRDFDQAMAATGEKEKLYCLAMQFFPLEEDSHAASGIDI